MKLSTARHGDPPSLALAQPRARVLDPGRIPPFPDLGLSIHPPFAPMESKPTPKLPRGTGFQFEPKWDGFRCLAFRDGDKVVLQSKSGQSLGRFFPEIVHALGALKATKFVLDGEIVVRAHGTCASPSSAQAATPPLPLALASDPPEHFTFDGLLQRIHPVDRSVASLAEALPASLILFDLLIDARGRSLTDRTLAERRLSLEDFARMYIVPGKLLRLTPATTQRWVVDEWQSALRGRGIDGIMIKRIDQPYLSGERSAMQKMKWVRTVDCVVGGVRVGSAGVRSLLLGLFDRDGVLHYVGSCIVTSAHRREHATALLDLADLETTNDAGGKGAHGERGAHVFSGRAPDDAPAPTSATATRRGKAHAWVPLDGSLVVEVQYDHAPARGVSFRHAAKLLRFRPDKAPIQCTTEQIESENQAANRARA